MTSRFDLGFVLVALFLCLASFANAQSNTPTTKEYEVGAGQLELPQTPSATALPDEAAARPSRTREEVERMTRDIAAGYRSMCCQHKSLLEASDCASYSQQMAMIEFLVERGYSREEIDEYVVNGGPPDLIKEYEQWLTRSHVDVPKDASEGERRSFVASYFSMPQVENKTFEGMGFVRGWSERVHGAPQNIGLYIVVALAGLFVLAAFVVAIRFSCARERSDASGGPANTSASAPLDERILREARTLEEP